MNAKLMTLRGSSPDLSYEWALMSQLIQRQNDGIFKDLRVNLRIDLTVLVPTLCSLEKWTEMAFDTVKRKMTSVASKQTAEGKSRETGYHEWAAATQAIRDCDVLGKLAAQSVAAAAALSIAAAAAAAFSFPAAASQATANVKDEVCPPDQSSALQTISQPPPPPQQQQQQGGDNILECTLGEMDFAGTSSKAHGSIATRKAECYGAAGDDDLGDNETNREKVNSEERKQIGKDTATIRLCNGLRYQTPGISKIARVYTTPSPVSQRDGKEGATAGSAAPAPTSTKVMADQRRQRHPYPSGRMYDVAEVDGATWTCLLYDHPPPIEGFEVSREDWAKSRKDVQWYIAKQLEELVGLGLRDINPDAAEQGAATVADTKTPRVFFTSAMCDAGDGGGSGGGVEGGKRQDEEEVGAGSERVMAEKAPRSAKKGLGDDKKLQQETARDEECALKQRRQQRQEKVPEEEEKRSGDLCTKTPENAEKMLAVQAECEGTTEEGTDKGESNTREEEKQTPAVVSAAVMRLFQDAYEARAKVNRELRGSMCGLKSREQAAPHPI